MAEGVGIERWVIVGRLRRTRGNRGEFLAEIYSSQPGRAERLREVRLEKDGTARQARVERVWHHDGRLVLKFEGLDSISDAEPWEGADILVEESQKAQPEEGEYSHADLIGCTLVSGPVPGEKEAGDGGTGEERTVGVVRGIEEYGGTPLLKVEAADGREVLVPFARSICREIDVAHKIIRVQLPEGLMEL